MSKLARRMQCLGCGCLYEGTNSLQCYCDPRCRARVGTGIRRVQFPSPLATAIPLSRRAILFRESIFRTRPTSAIGYRLWCRELCAWFPFAGATKRYDGRISSDRFFILEPFEAPLVPFDTYYDLEWVTEQGHPIETRENPVSVSFPHPTSARGSAANKILHRVLSIWRDNGAVLLDLAGNPRSRAGEPVRVTQLDGRRPLTPFSLMAQQIPQVPSPPERANLAQLDGRRPLTTSSLARQTPQVQSPPEQAHLAPSPGKALLRNDAGPPEATPVEVPVDPADQIRELEKLTASLPAEEQAPWLHQIASLRQQLDGPPPNSALRPPSKALKARRPRT